MSTNIGTDAGAMPAKVSNSVRARSIIGLAKLVDDDHQYAGVMEAQPANGPSAARPARTRAKTSTTRPNVASPSDRHSSPPDRSFVEKVIALRAKMRFPAIGPQAPLGPG